MDQPPINSNTTLVKVKSRYFYFCIFSYIIIQIQHLLKLNDFVYSFILPHSHIQIQHLLKLNVVEVSFSSLFASYSNTTLVKVKFSIG